jgi:hypothetical protein
LYHSYYVRKEIKFNPITSARDYELRKLSMDSISKYKRYTFSQIRDAGGALQLSRACPFIHIIEKEGIEYRGCKIAIFHRTKNAAQSKGFPAKVLEVFKNDSVCRAVAYIYKNPITRFVMFEKTGKPTKEKLQEIEEGIYYF